MPIYNGTNKVKPSGIDKIYVGNNLVYQSGTEPEPFYLQTLNEATQFWFTKHLTPAPSITTMQYKIGGGEWVNWTDPYNTKVEVPANTKIYIKSSMNTLNGNVINSNHNFNAGGNCNSLINNVKNFTSNNNYAFYALFFENQYLKSIDNLVLPATTLTNCCYSDMFALCSGLTSLPSGLLPATTLASSCYTNMFRICSGLSSLPSGLLPATQLSGNCYVSMFRGCTGLTSLPNNLLPSNTLASGCYAYMFEGCSNLNSLPNNLLSATILASNCYVSMFEGCSNLKMSENTGTGNLVLDLSSFDSLPANATYNMFYNTGGTFTDTPTAGNKYYSS